MMLIVGAVVLVYVFVFADVCRFVCFFVCVCCVCGFVVVF